MNVKPRKKDMWTEVTKDLVLREAIDQCGYSCEETDDFFYVMEYLQYVRTSTIRNQNFTDHETGGCSSPRGDL